MQGSSYHGVQELAIERGSDKSDAPLFAGLDSEEPPTEPTSDPPDGCRTICGRIPSANEQVESARTVLTKPSMNPWEVVYHSVKQALDGIRKWRCSLEPDARPTEYQILRVPGAKGRYTIGGLFAVGNAMIPRRGPSSTEDEHLVWYVTEGQMLDHEALKRDPDLDPKEREELPGLWDYLAATFQ